jgi:Fe-S cluster biogenesis protein NfuA
MKLMITIFIATLPQIASAFRVVENPYISIEGAHIEILHNNDKNSGRIIVRKANCSGCAPISLTYSNPIDVFVKGYPSGSNKITKSAVTQGDIGYDPKTNALVHINFYK